MERFNERMLLCTYVGVDEMVEGVVDWVDNFTGMNNLGFSSATILESKAMHSQEGGRGPRRLYILPGCKDEVVRWR